MTSSPSVVIWSMPVLVATSLTSGRKVRPRSDVPGVELEPAGTALGESEPVMLKTLSVCVSVNVGEAG